MRGYRSRQRVDVHLEERVRAVVPRGHISDDVNHGRVGAARVVQVGDGVGEAGAEVKDLGRVSLFWEEVRSRWVRDERRVGAHRARVFAGDARVSVRGAGAHRLVESEDGSDGGNLVQRADEPHLRRARGWRRPPPRPPPRARGGAPQLPSRGRLRGTGRARARARWTRGASSSDGAAMRTVRACRSASKRAARSFRGGNVHLEASCTSRRFASFARRRPRNQARHVCTTSKTPSSITSDSAVVSITHVTPQKRTDNAARSWQTRAAIRHDATRGHASRGSAAAPLRVVGMVRSSRARAQPRRLPVCSCCFSSRCTTCCNSR